MNIRQKITLAFVLVIVLIAGFGALTIHSDIGAKRKIDTILLDHLQEMRAANEIAYWLQRAKSNIREILVEELAGLVEQETKKGREHRKEELKRSRGIVFDAQTEMKVQLDALRQATEEGIAMGAAWEGELVQHI